MPTLDQFSSLRWERMGNEFRITFLGTQPLEEYIQRVLALIDRTGVELLHLDTGADEIEEAFLRRLEEDRSRGILRVAAWAATQEISGQESTLRSPVFDEEKPRLLAEQPLPPEQGSPAD